MRIGDLVKIGYKRHATDQTPVGLVLKREYEPGDFQYPGERRCFILFADGVREWVHEESLTIISHAQYRHEER
jgi:hypothetical protein